MVIRKEDALSVVQNREVDSYRKLVKLFDEAITDYFGVVALIPVIVLGYAVPLVQRVIEEYRKVGWECTYGPDEQLSGIVMLA